MTLTAFNWLIGMVTMIGMVRRITMETSLLIGQIPVLNSEMLFYHVDSDVAKREKISYEHFGNLILAGTKCECRGHGLSLR